MKELPPNPRRGRRRRRTRRGRRRKRRKFQMTPSSVDVLSIVYWQTVGYVARELSGMLIHR